MNEAFEPLVSSSRKTQRGMKFRIQHPFARSMGLAMIGGLMIYLDDQALKLVAEVSNVKLQIWHGTVWHGMAQYSLCVHELKWMRRVR